MPERCVAARCGNIKDEANGISLHRIPFFGTTLRRRKKWIDFMLGAEEDVDARLERPRPGFCSMYFNDDDFIRLMNSGLNL